MNCAPLLAATPTSNATKSQRFFSLFLLAAFHVLELYSCVLDCMDIWQITNRVTQRKPGTTAC